MWLLTIDFSLQVLEVVMSYSALKRGEKEGERAWEQDVVLIIF